MIGYSKDQQIGKTKPKQKEINISANEKLDIIYKEKGLFDTCEINIDSGCLKNSKTSTVGTKLKLTYAHRHKRIWYKQPDRIHLLYAFTETIRCCLPCHIKTEYDRKITNNLFNKLRGTQFTRKFTK